MTADSRSVGRRNYGGAASTSVSRKDKRDASTIRKERIQAVKDDNEKQVLN